MESPKQRDEKMSAAIARRTGWKMLWLAPALVLCGCADISEQTNARLGTPAFAPTQPASIRILATAPKQATEKLGEVILTVNGSASRRQIEGRLQAAAARLGADGVFIASDQTHVYPVEEWGGWGPPAGFTDWQRIIVGVAFKYK